MTAAKEEVVAAVPAGRVQLQRLVSSAPEQAWSRPLRQAVRSSAADADAMGKLAVNLA